MKRVAIIHPWIPQYRIAFFERLRARLAEERIELVIGHGHSPLFAEGRGDERGLDWATGLSQRRLRLGRRSLTFRRAWRPALDADLLILEDAIRNLDTPMYLLRRRRSARPTAFWGHGRTMDWEVSGPERELKRLMARRADWWFAYTEGTTRHLEAIGFPSGRITTVGNTIDARALSRARDAIGPSAAAATRSRLGLTEGHTGLFIGGLSATKNLGLLIAASRLIAEADPDFRVVIAGEGPDRGLLEAAQDAPLVTVGPVFDEIGKAELAAACDFMLFPGLVGLGAVDSLALGLPSVAVSPWHHAPEFEYLQAGVNCVITQPSASDYARGITGLIDNPVFREGLSARCRQDAGAHDIDGMVERFAVGISSAIAAGPVS